MSGLAGLLSGTARPDVWRWHGTQPVDDVRRTVTSAGWSFGAVDGWAITDRRQALAAIGVALDFPDHYGGNLDALADCLGDLAVDTVLLWDGWSALAEADPAGFRGVLTVLTDISRGAGPGARPGARRFACLLRGAGPELTGVATLA